MKFEFVDEHRDTRPVRLMCDALGVSAGGCCAWRSRSESRRAIEHKTLPGDIRRVHGGSGGSYACLLCPALTGGGSAVTMARLMRGAGLRGLAAMPRRMRRTDSRHGCPPPGKTIHRIVF